MKKFKVSTKVYLAQCIFASLKQVGIFLLLYNNSLKLLPPTKCGD